MTERKSFKSCLKKHKGMVIGVGACILTAALIVVGIQNPDIIETILDSLKKNPDKSQLPSGGWMGDISSQPQLSAIEAMRSSIEIPPFEVFEDAITEMKISSASVPFEVRKHVRNLPNGWNASNEKIATALENGIVLLDGQTWVDGYMKGGTAA